MAVTPRPFPREREGDAVPLPWLHDPRWMHDTRGEAAYEDVCMRCRERCNGTLCIECRTALRRDHWNAVCEMDAAVLGLEGVCVCRACAATVHHEDCYTMATDAAGDVRVPLCVRCAIAHRAEDFAVLSEAVVKASGEVERRLRQRDDAAAVASEGDRKARCVAALRALHPCFTTCARCGRRRPPSMLSYVDGKRVLCSRCAWESGTDDADTLWIEVGIERNTVEVPTERRDWSVTTLHTLPTASRVYVALIADALRVHGGVDVAGKSVRSIDPRWTAWARMLWDANDELRMYPFVWHANNNVGSFNGPPYYLAETQDRLMTHFEDAYPEEFVQFAEFTCKTIFSRECHP